MVSVSLEHSHTSHAQGYINRLPQLIERVRKLPEEAAPLPTPPEPVESLWSFLLRHPNPCIRSKNHVRREQLQPRQWLLIRGNAPACAESPAHGARPSRAHLGQRPRPKHPTQRRRLCGRPTAQSMSPPGCPPLRTHRCNCNIGVSMTPSFCYLKTKSGRRQV